MDWSGGDDGGAEAGEEAAGGDDAGGVVGVFLENKADNLFMVGVRVEREAVQEKRGKNRLQQNCQLCTRNRNTISRTQNKKKHVTCLFVPTFACYLLHLE